MKFLLCIVLIAFVSAQIPDRPRPGRHFDFTHCCKVEKSAATMQFIEMMMNLAEECIHELGEPVQGKPPKFACFHECIGNKTNVLNADKSLNNDAYRSFVTSQMATEDYQKAVADGIVTKCLEFATAEKNSSEEQIQDDCNNTALKAFHCASKELINSCPADQQETDENCLKYREFVNTVRAKGPRPTGAPTSN